MPTPVTILLPAHNEGSLLESAAACMFAQTHRDFTLLLILNAADAATAHAAAAIAAKDRRVRVIEKPRGHLAGALNAGIAAAQTEWLVRMDADDTCTPDRIERQLAFAAEHPDLAAIGSAFTTVDQNGRVLAVHRPPTDAAEARWRLFISNPFAHGSMLLRRSAVIAAGGYNESLQRAQDLDLWFRLNGKIAAAPEVLYTHRQRASDSYSGSAQQAACAAHILTSAWRDLPRAPSGRVELALAEAMAPAVDGAATRGNEIERLLREQGPSLDLLTAWLWLREHVPPLSRVAADVCLGARVREVVAPLAQHGTTRMWIWGAGPHTGRVLPHLEAAGMRIAGIVDDFAAGRELHGFVAKSPSVLAAGDVVLLSSDAIEDRLWVASAGARARGVRVVPLYAAHDHGED